MGDLLDADPGGKKAIIEPVPVPEMNTELEEQKDRTSQNIKQNLFVVVLFSRSVMPFVKPF